MIASVLVVAGVWEFPIPYYYKAWEFFPLELQPRLYQNCAAAAGHFKGVEGCCKLVGMWGLPMGTFKHMAYNPHIICSNICLISHRFAHGSF